MSDSDGDPPPAPEPPHAAPTPGGGKRLTVASLFSGAGGLDLGFHEAGHKIVLQCESDPGAQQVREKREREERKKREIEKREARG